MKNNATLVGISQGGQRRPQGNLSTGRRQESCKEHRLLILLLAVVDMLMKLRFSFNWTRRSFVPGFSLHIYMYLNFIALRAKPAYVGI